MVNSEVVCFNCFYLSFIAYLVVVKTLPYNMYAVQQDKQSFLMTEFYSSHMLARHVSDLTGPSSGAFFTSCMCRFGMW